MKKQTNTTKTAKKVEHAHDHNHDHNHDEHDHVAKNPFIGENTKFTIEIPWKNVQEAYEIVLTKACETTEVAGFRKGKAPKKLVEEKLGKVKLYDETAYVALQKAYTKEVTDRKIRPVVDPQIKPISMEEEKAWTFEVETALAPEVKLGDYKAKLSDAKAKSAIWTPAKGDPKDEKKPTDDDKLRAIFSTLLENIHVQIPELLLRSEVNAALTRLVNQLDSMKISLEDYLKNTGKTADQLRGEYAASSLGTLQLEFILNAIAQEEKIHVEEKEIDDIIAKIEDPEMKKLGANPYQRMQVHLALSKRKTLDFLLAL